uniref:Uncharacterized protein n=1 Tax=Tanacetum cinerariifolium TaxID=118510 RepID=A0A699WCK0_TANCI|nr:hypothetical protein [Tanacetum cinerariifolium]
MYQLLSYYEVTPPYSIPLRHAFLGVLQPPNTPNNLVDKKDSDFDEILDDLFCVGAENLRRIGQEKVQNGWNIDTSGDTDHESGNFSCLTSLMKWTM